MGRGGAPAREISFVSLVASGPKVFLLSLSHGGWLQLLKPGRVVPNSEGPWSVWLDWVEHGPCALKGCGFNSQSGHISRLWVQSPVGVHSRGNQT